MTVLEATEKHSKKKIIFLSSYYIAQNTLKIYIYIFFYIIIVRTVYFNQ